MGAQRPLAAAAASACLVLGLLLPPGAASAATVVNGGFETGDFTGWTVVDQPGDSGSWFVYTGTTAPLSRLPTAAPPEGTHAATTDQNSRGSHILYQDVAPAPASHHTLSFFLYHNNSHTIFSTPNSLDYNLSPNQLKTFDLTPFAGQTVRLRFAEVDNHGYFRASVDAVTIKSTPTTGLTLACSPARVRVGTPTTCTATYTG